MTENTHYHCRQTNRMKSLLPTISWNDQSLYSLVKDTFLWIDVVLPLIRDSLEKRSIADTCGELLPSILRNAVCRSPWNHLKSGFAIYSVIDGSLAVFRVQSIYPLPTLSSRTAKRRSQRDWSPFTSFFPSIAFYAPNRRSFLSSSFLLSSFTPSISPSLFLPIPQTIRFMSSKSSVTSIFRRFTRRSTRPKRFFARAFFPLSGKRAFRPRNRCICCRFEALD